MSPYIVLRARKYRSLLHKKLFGPISQLLGTVQHQTETSSYLNVEVWDALALVHISPAVVTVSASSFRELPTTLAGKYKPCVMPIYYVAG